MAYAILPRSLGDPTGLFKLERRAIAEFRRKVKEACEAYAPIVNKIPVFEIVTNAVRYDFRIDGTILENLITETEELVDRILLGNMESNWFINGYAIPAFDRGTSLAYANISAQSVEYGVHRGTLENLFRQPQYQRRIGLLRAREFEEMKAFSANTKKVLSRTLADGMSRGLNPRDIARAIVQDVPDLRQFDADRIARTELSTALKRARREEAQEAMQQFNFRILMLHISAMSPTTRAHHAFRNATLHTIEEQQDWYSVDANAINCKCSEIEVLVDSQGNPLAPSVIALAQRRKLQYAGMKKEAA